MAQRGNTNFRKQRTITEERIEKWRKYKYFLLIVCEDESTEPNYLNTFKEHFPEHTLYLEVAGAGLDPLGVVNLTLDKMKILEGLTKRTVYEAWAVFDKDDADLNQRRTNRFNNALLIANENNIKTAWSNEVFELWLLLHFEDIDPQAPIPRLTIYDRLRDCINRMLEEAVIDDGHSNTLIIPYLSSHGNEALATDRAQALLAYHTNKSVIDSNPATRMHLLIESLRNWITYYNYQP